MKKLLILLIVLLLTSTESYTEVYICDSKDGKKYHYTKSCRGLNACKHNIIKMHINEAKNRGKTLCSFED